MLSSSGAGKIKVPESTSHSGFKPSSRSAKAVAGSDNPKESKNKSNSSSSKAADSS